MEKMGFLGGTFDPIHNGHIAIANEALRQLKLSKVVFIPARQQPLKYRDDITPARQRLQMIRLAIKNHPDFEVSTIELDRPAPSYTVDTLSILKETLGENKQIYFIMGWDEFIEIPQWKDPQKIISLCMLVAVARNSIPEPDIKKLESRLPGISSKSILIKMTPVNISSTEIRQRVARGSSIRGLVPEEVEKYIREKKLYIKKNGKFGRKN